ncbi:MAG: glycosyltransferase [Dehalococcoidia bacterium]
MTAQPAVDVSIVIPAYNEQDRIRPTLEEYITYLRDQYGEGFELLVVLNGCKDRTRQVVEEAARGVPQVRILEYASSLGKGGAIWEGLALAQGTRLAFADADNMVRAPEVDKLLAALDSHDIAIADRFAGRNEAGSQPLSRKLISMGSRFWVRKFLGLPYSDTQCGAKAFRASAWRRIASAVEERSWAFDLDVLAQARRQGLRVAEVPVQWRHVSEGTKVRAWKDVPATFLATFRIRRRAQRD